MSSREPIRTLNFQDCPIGRVLNHADPDQSVEERFFAGWEEPHRPPLNHAPGYRVWAIHEEAKTGRQILQHDDKRQSALITGSPSERDCAVTARLRQILPTSLPNQDSEHNLTGRTGVVVRHCSVRRHYFFCIDGADDFVLYRRQDEERVKLGSAGIRPDPANYHDLRLEAEGEQLRCFLDGRLVIEARDTAYAYGKAGIRTNTLSRVESVEVSRSEAEAREVAEREANHQAESKRRSAEHAKAALWREIPVGDFHFLGFGQHRDREAPVAWLVHTEPAGAPPHKAERSTVRTVDMEGEELWRLSGEGGLNWVCNTTKSDFEPKDFNGDGSSDFVFVWNEKLTLVDGTTGRIRHQADPPASAPFAAPRNTKAIPGAKPGRPVVVNTVQLVPGPDGAGVILSENNPSGGNSLWAYDGRLNLLWTRHVDNPKFGHSTFCFDLDGDGAEEILACGYLFDARGQLIWRLEGSEFWDRYLGARHVDEASIANLTGTPGELTSVHACGAEGLVYADARTGEVKCHHIIGHVQFATPGNFRPDLPGLEVWCTTRHGNFGITALYDARGDELLYFQPHYELAAPRRIRWQKEKHDLVHFASAKLPAKALRGLYDGEGHRVVEEPPGEGDDFTHVILTGMGPDGGDAWAIVGNGGLRIYRPEA